MKEQYGEFSRQGDEYIIYRPDTPTPWVNTITNGIVTSRISATGEGEITLCQSHQPITRPAINPVESHQPARRLYIRDIDTGESWSMGDMVQKSFEAAHGLSHTRVHFARYQIETAITFFLPPEDSCEVWRVKVRNSGQSKRRLSVFAVVEWPCQDIDQHQTELREGALLAIDRGRDDSPVVIKFLAGDHPFDSFDTLESAFVGRQGSYTEPISIRDGRCSRSLGSGSQPIGAWQKNLTLAAAGETEFCLFVGQVTGKGKTGPLAEQSARSQIKRLVTKYRQPQAVTQAFEAASQTAHELTRRNLVKSPDLFFDYLFNYWMTQPVWSLAQNNEISEAVFDLIPVLAAHDLTQAKTLLETALTRQHKDGQLFDAERTELSQSLARGVINYIKESGDLAFLDKHLDYEDSGEGSVLQHVVRAMDYATGRFSRRHLPTATTEKTLTTDQHVEYQVHACQLYWNLRSLSPIFDAIGEHELVRKYERISAKLREAVNEHFWDGSWYGSSLRDGKRDAGFKRNDYHKVGVAEQVWSVISGLASQERGTKALAAVHAHLLTKSGLATLWPAYPRPTSDAVSQAVTGANQNGGIIVRENALAVAATALLGDGDMAYKLWQLSNPAHLAAKPEQYQGAPFAHADSLYGPAHPLFGRIAGVPRGSAVGWAWQSCSHSLLGIQPVLGGLKLDPCLPRDWRQVEVTRQFRGAEYHIRIINSFRQNRGVDRILVNGVRITGQVVPVQGPGVHFVEVVIG